MTKLVDQSLSNPTIVRRWAILLIWSLALWNSWECGALYSDGAWFFLSIIKKGSFLDYNDLVLQQPLARQYAIAISQIPVVGALQLGVTNLRWLAAFFSFGLYALPAALYTLALVQAKDSVLLVSVTVASVAALFFTTSFFIVGEYNTAYALSIAAIVSLTRHERPSFGSGTTALLLALLGLRTYESMLYLGPLLGIATLIPLASSGHPWRFSLVRATGVWTAAIAGAAIIFCVIHLAIEVWWTPVLLVLALSVAFIIHRLSGAVHSDLFLQALYVSAGALFISSSFVAILSVSRLGSAAATPADMIYTSAGFVRNIQLDLLLLVFVLQPIRVLCRSAYEVGLRRLTLVLLLVLAISPLLSLSHSFGFPPGTLSYSSRTVGGALAAAFIGAAIAFRYRLYLLFANLNALGQQKSLTQFLVVASLAFLAMVPFQVATTLGWRSFVSGVRATIQSNSGTIHYEERPELQWYYWNADKKYLSALSVILKESTADGIITVKNDPYFNILPTIPGYSWSN